MIFDTDIFIWAQRGNEKAAKIINDNEERIISIQTYMELLQCAQNRSQHKYTKDFLSSYNFQMLPITENISHRAAVYIEEYSGKIGIRAGDAIIAATATEHNLTLVTSNKKHFKSIHELQLKIFIP